MEYSLTNGVEKDNLLISGSYNIVIMIVVTSQWAFHFLYFYLLLSIQLRYALLNAAFENYLTKTPKLGMRSDHMRKVFVFTKGILSPADMDLLNRLSTLHHHMTNATETLNECFSFQVMMNMAYNFITCIGCLFSVCCAWLQGSGFNYVNDVLWTFYYFFCIRTIISIAANTTNEVCIVCAQRSLRETIFDLLW